MSAAICKFLGEIVKFEGMICLQTAPNCYYPLTGNSGIAYDFCNAFGRPIAIDVGKRVFRINGVMQMENDEQLAARLAHDPDANRAWKPKMGRRVYACCECGTEKTINTNHTGTVWATPCAGDCRDIYAANTAREIVIWHPARRHRYIREAE